MPDCIGKNGAEDIDRREGSSSIPFEEARDGDKCTVIRVQSTQGTDKNVFYGGREMM
jgi:hypothetical protein